MPRPKHQRKISVPPIMTGYKPFGISGNRLCSVTLQFDEYEAIRLLDYEGMNQELAAEKMNVSRPTLTRIYENARKTLATAFVEGKLILIEGGPVYFDKQWFRCKRCHKLIAGMGNHTKCSHCNCYGSDELIPVNAEQK